MSTAVRMPNLGAEATEGRVSRWTRAVGDTVVGGEVLAEIETEKASLDLEAPASGVLSEILVPAGSDAPVGALLATIDERSSRSSGSPMRRDGALEMRGAHAIASIPTDTPQTQG